MAIRLAALDVDGTLLAPDNSITPATKEAIREAKAAGIEIVVCTGRAFVEVRDILRQLPEVRYLSCGTGAYALDVWTMETLYECSMPEELGRQAYRAVAQADCMVHFYTGLSVRHSRWCMDHFTDYMEEKMRTLMEQSHIIVDDLDAFVESYHGPVEKLYVTFPNRAEYEKAYEAVRKLPVFLTDGGWAVDLEVMSRDTDKGVALKALASRLGIPREQVLAMGDSGNDCAMLRYAGIEAGPYGQFLWSLQNTIPALTFVGYTDARGNAYSHLEDTVYTGKIEDYQRLQYVRLFGGEELPA